MGWGFWYVKGGFHNVFGSKVLEWLVSIAGTRGVCSWVRQFGSPREFEVSWDDKVRGAGRSRAAYLRAPLCHLF